MKADFGYISSCVAVRKQKLSRGHIRYLERRLEFMVEGQGSIMQAYDEDETYYYIPKGVLLDPEFPELPPVIDQRVSHVVDIPDPIIQLRPHQKSALKKLRRKTGGILKAPTGAGKTVVMTYLIGKLKQRTLVIVHTRDLQDQWIEAAKMVLGMAEEDIGVIGAGNMVEKNLTIATVQTLARYDFNKANFPEHFGCVIQDEAHRGPAASFAKVLSAMPARYMYGCTATVTRNDGMHPLMHALLGPVVAEIKETDLVNKGKLILPTVRMVKTPFKSQTGGALAVSRNRFAKQKLYAKLIKELVHDTDRNQLIVDIVMKHKDESVLVLSERTEHLHIIHDLILQQDWTVNVRVVTGSVPMAERRRTLDDMREGRVNVLLATQLADEGLDLPVLNVLVLTFPGKAVERLTQRIGRIMRAFEGKDTARVYDLVDANVPVFRKHAVTRRAHYKQSKKMKVKGWKPTA